MRFYEEHAADRDRFEVLAFHDEAAKTFAELDPKLADLKEKAWGGKDLPFPILLDASGKTCRDFGIRAFPTTILIDPQGNLVKHGSEDELAVTLGEGRPAVVARARALSAAAAKRDEALALLAAMGTADGLDGVYALSLFLRDCKDPEIAEAAIDALDRIGGDAAMDRIRELGVTSKDARRQARAGTILGNRTPVDRLHTLYGLLNSPDIGLPLARAICGAFAARAEESTEIPEALVGMTESKSPVLREAAMEAVVTCRAAGGRERLQAILAGDGVEQLRVVAARGLGQLGDAAAADALRTAVTKDRSALVRNAAKEALAALEPK